MDTSDLNTKLIDYIDGKLDEAEKAVWEQKIKDNPEVAREYHQLRELMGLMERRIVQPPDKRLETGFLSMLEDEIIEMENTLEDMEKNIRKEKVKVYGLKLSGPLGIAASVVLVLIGTLIGMFVIKSGQDGQISSLKKELDATKAMVINSLEGQSSPSQRIAGVNASFKLKEADDEIITVLINTMKNDNNINVRLAAIEALYQFSSEERVKDAFVHALARQKEPVIQLTLINILVNLKENRAIDHMQKIIEDKQTIKSVKDEAQLGVYKLS
ncbi:MAG: HEAT repeat domain-containing protein [Cytophagales bacterium]|nr:HEAT repeat domain-containing protein [Cytophagales bacterium]